eukprot:TRINITY_DN31178_c0_g1_i1.p1 TRINITY_DN31178_c0_g1~~TRINITY_DN31178_c0_g1_i1.p1  ORF type:complete len:641 (-),score=129.55 TRINITY_DN31178_c0_g1_i1:117-2018(-)
MSLDPHAAQRAMLAALGGYIAWKVLDNQLMLSHDLGLARRLAPLLRETKNKLALPSYQVTDMWYEVLAKNPNKPCFIFNGQPITFAEGEKISNRIANWARTLNLQKGDCVALIMENRPEFVFTWLGLTKAGLVISFINHNLRTRSLVHSVKVAESKAVIFGSEVINAVGEVAAELTAIYADMKLYCLTGFTLPTTCVPQAWFVQLDPILGQSPETKPDPKWREGRSFGSTFCYIYTSGTTGLPKACVITHSRLFSFGAVLHYGFGVNEKDRVYTCLPLYHSAGGGLGIGVMLVTGCTIVLARKFSAKHFWEDCSKNKVTAIQYIGELCRYLLATPNAEFDTKHKIRIAIGNGLRPEIWDTFQRRFKIPEIGEFYGATEGNIAFVNHCQNYQGQGAVGRAGWLHMRLRFRLVKFDIENEVPVRDANGFCVECATGESGELIAPIKDDMPFSGYTDKASTEKKILRDVFKKGDTWFRTGDLLRRDKAGYLYFVDRIGDTFRWKGENVSTTEVAEVISTFPGIIEANVYGVQVPNTDGRACMAALVTDEGAQIDMEKLGEHIHHNLPSYAVPLFIRFLQQMHITSTFKHQKVELRNEGIDPSKVKDPLWWLNPATRKYEIYDAKAHETIVQGRAKL